MRTTQGDRRAGPSTQNNVKRRVTAAFSSEHTNSPRLNLRAIRTRFWVTAFLRDGRQVWIDLPIWNQHVAASDRQLNGALQVSRPDRLENDRFRLCPCELMHEVRFGDRRAINTTGTSCDSCTCRVSSKPFIGPVSVTPVINTAECDSSSAPRASSPESTTAPIGTPIVSKHSETAAMVARSLSTIIARPSIRSYAPVGTSLRM